MFFTNKSAGHTLLLFTAFALINALVLPNHLILKNDDFGYLDSVVRTLSEGRIATSDFLEPFAITLTSFSVLIYKIGNNLWLATYGLLFIIQLVLWWIFWLLICKYFTEKYAALLTSCLLFFPLVLGKLHEFTSVSLYWTFFFGFILCWPRRPFLACALLILGFGCRQSAVTLLALPFFSIINKRDVRTSLIVIFTSLAACVAISVNMEPSFAQLHTTYKMRESFQWATFVRSLFAFSLFSLAGSGAANALTVVMGRDFRRRWVLGLVVLLYVVILRPWNEWIGLDMVYLGSIPYAQALIFIGLASLVFFIPTHWRSIRIQFVLLSLGTILLPSIRGAVWDYYGVEIALVGALTVQPELRPWRTWPRLLKSGIIVYALVCLTYSISLWRFHDLTFLRIKLYEQALRNQKITIHEVSRGSFGYTGWKLFDSMVKWQSTKDEFRGLAAFLCEMNEEASVIASQSDSLDVTRECTGVHDSRSYIAGTVQGNVLGRTEILDLLVPCSYRIPDQSRSHCLAPGEVLKTKAFPLNEAEWSAFIEGKM